MQVIFTDLKTAQMNGFEIWGFSSVYNMYILKKEDVKDNKQYAFASINEDRVEDS